MTTCPLSLPRLTSPDANDIAAQSRARSPTPETTTTNNNNNNTPDNRALYDRLLVRACSSRGGGRTRRSWSCRTVDANVIHVHRTLAPPPPLPPPPTLPLSLSFPLVTRHRALAIVTRIAAVGEHSIARPPVRTACAPRDSGPPKR